MDNNDIPFWNWNGFHLALGLWHFWVTGFLAGLPWFPADTLYVRSLHQAPTGGPVCGYILYWVLADDSLRVIILLGA